MLVAYRHGLRAQELCDLEWSQIDWKAATLHVLRVKSGKPAAHPIRGDELRALRELHRNQEPASPFVFTTERGGPFTTDAVNRLVKRLGESNKLFGFPIHMHMLRHSCGFYLAKHGHDLRLIQDYLGHRDPKHTAHYTRTAAGRFEELWR